MRVARRARRPGSPAAAVLATLLLLAGACERGLDEPLEPIVLRALPLDVEAPPARPPERPWNLVLISLDTLRADHLGAYGYARATSPRIDALAREGVLFEQAYSTAPKTAPAHMSLMTGLYPPAHGVRNFEGRIDVSLGADVPTLAEILRVAGYRTAATTSGGNVHRDLGFGRGFQVYEHLPGEAEPVFDRALAHLERLAAAGPEAPPFLLFVHTFQLHDPYVPPPETRALFVDPDYRGKIVSDRDALTRLAGEEWHQRNAMFWAGVDPEDPADLQHLKDLYDACLRAADNQVGRLLDALDRLALREDTLLVLLSDHGEEFHDHGGFGHDTLYDELLRVPLLMRLPPGASPLPEGARVEPVVRLVDVLPTILELLGLPSLEHAQGRSLLPLLRGAEERERAAYAYHVEVDASALRAQDWKLVSTPEARVVFDLSRDAAERRGRSADGTVVGDDLARALGSFTSWSERIRQLAPPGKPVALDPETRRSLEALGYLRPEGAPKRGAPAGVE